MNEERFNPLKVVRWTDRIRGAVAGYKAGPIRANLDLTNLCNHDCSWCEPLAYRTHSIDDRRHTLSKEVASQVIADLSDMGCEAIYFSGGGEPTLHKEFGELLIFARSLRMKTFVITNGSRIKRWGPHLQTYADHIRVSLDASCEEEHMAIHGSRPGEFAEILQGIKFLVDIRNSGANVTKPEVGVSYTVEARNMSLGSIRLALGVARDVGVDYIQFRPCSSDKFAPEATVIGLDKKAFDQMAFEICPEVKVLAMNWRNTDTLTQREFSKCWSALTVAVIGATGEVQACCDNRAVVFGNVNEKRFRDIWLSEEHNKLAAAIEPKLCPRCLQCGFNKGVQDFVVNNEALVEFV